MVKVSKSAQTAVINMWMRLSLAVLARAQCLILLRKQKQENDLRAALPQMNQTDA